MPQIEVSGLCRSFKVPEREAGFRAALSSLVHRRYRTVRAVDHIDFTIEQGDRCICPASQNTYQMM